MRSCIYSSINAVQNEECFIAGCTNPNAINYNELANYDDNSCEYLDVFPCELGVVYISEAHNFGDPDYYIEIYNSGESDCLLSGFMLDDEQPFDDYVFNNTIIEAGDYWVGYEGSTDSFNSGLGSDGDIVVFADADGSILITLLEQSLDTLDGIEL